MEEFNISEYMAREARKLKADKGILAVRNKKLGKVLADDIKQKVVQFFENQEFCRICPGRKDFFSVRVDGKKGHKQKLLLLSNLKEIHLAYRNRNGPEIGFSDFVS